MKSIDKKAKGIEIDNVDLERMDTEELNELDDMIPESLLNSQSMATGRFSKDLRVIYPCIHRKQISCQKCENDLKTHS